VPFVLLNIPEMRPTLLAYHIHPGLR